MLTKFYNTIWRQKVTMMIYKMYLCELVTRNLNDNIHASWNAMRFPMEEHKIPCIYKNKFDLVVKMVNQTQWYSGSCADKLMGKGLVVLRLGNEELQSFRHGRIPIRSTQKDTCYPITNENRTQSQAKHIQYSSTLLHQYHIILLVFRVDTISIRL